MTDEPWVLETPPDVLGIIDDHWFKYVGDFGRLGPDKSKGGKFLILPPGYDGVVPDGYFVLRTNTYGNWVIWRGLPGRRVTEAGRRNDEESLPHVPAVAEDNDPPQMNFVNASGKFNNTIHRMDYGIWEEINAVVQAEPSEGQNPEILGVLASIGIEKGQPFDPDERMKADPERGRRCGRRHRTDDHVAAAGRRVLFVPEREPRVDEPVRWGKP